MDTTYSTNRKSKRMFVNILSIFVILAIAFPATGSALAQEPNPHFTVFPEWEFFDGLEWPDGATVSISVAGKPECSLERESWGGFFNGNFPEGCDLEIGDTVTFADGTTIRTHVVRNLDVTDINLKNDTINGIADPSSTVFVWPHDGWFEPLQTIANSSGAWKVDLGDVGYDIVEGASGRSDIRDEAGNATAVDWHAANPRFVVFPEWEWFDGVDWPDGASVKITVKGKPECKVTRESWGGFFNGNFGEGCDVAIGDEVSFADGNTTLTHVVRNLAITAVDPGENTITGTADAGTLVYVWPHDGWFEPLQAIANDSGVWQVDLDGVRYDIQPGASGRSEIRDEMGNATAVDWYVPNPHFEVRDEANSVAGWEWQPNDEVNISVNGSFVITAPTDGGGYFNIILDEPVDLTPGSNVEVTDGASTKVHIVTNLSIQNVNVDTDLVSGVATPNGRIQAEVCGPDGCIQRWETVGGTGNWSADFSVPGDEPGEEQTFDFGPGMWLDSREWDDDGDNTIAGYYIPNPRFTIFPLWQWYDGLDWPDGATVNITVDGQPACNVTKTSWNYFFNGGFSQACHVGVGDTITFTDGTTTRTHVVQNLAITAIDLNKDTISGTADAGTTVYVWPHDGWFEPLQAIANNSGKWQVDLGDVGYDILEGAAGRSEIRDEFGNSTAVDWNLNARIVVQITDDWFRAESFQPNTSLNFQIYDAPGGKRLIKSATAQTNGSGEITHWVGDKIDLVPGNHVIVSDGKTTRDIVLEALTFDVFDTSLGILQGTAPEPFGRTVSVGVGCWQRDDLTMDTTTDENGAWIADFGAPVPNDFGCVFAWVYDEDGDVSEVRPEEIIWWNE